MSNVTAIMNSATEQPIQKITFERMPIAPASIRTTTRRWQLTRFSA
ncbi:hypothetical protein [Alteraurantiacibacter buctensis]|uniref:Uncharacterized protein n=1 Tax=Alteraurantiacibacter buctensis TaxID=1503981 RepID=A0A844YY72_9SPHN|nr:hypothetical protein [Alteraurantiacibacter buctensis]MXO72132.1 hypothetical protein [Alteraurantiacibacter buctensis]